MCFRDEDQYLSLIKNIKDEGGENFDQLYLRYWPLVRRLWQRYNVAGLEIADWAQEARLVMLESIRLYNDQGLKMFNGFFKECLTNRIRDLQRESLANKRIPSERLCSLTNDYAESIIDFLHHEPDEIIYCRQCISRFLNSCSSFERRVLTQLHRGYSIEETCVALNCSKRSIQSALHRCHLKLLAVLNK